MKKKKADPHLLEKDKGNQMEEENVGKGCTGGEGGSEGMRRLWIIVSLMLS